MAEHRKLDRGPFVETFSRPKIRRFSFFLACTGAADSLASEELRTQNNPASQSGVFNLRVVLALLLFSGGTSLALLSAIDPGGATLSINDVTLAEDNCQNTSFVFTVTLSRLRDHQAVSVSYATQDGGAVANKDYVPTAGTLIFTHGMKPNGPHGSYLLVISVPLGNYVVSSGGNDARTFTVQLSGATNATITKAQGVGTLTNAALSCMPAQNGVCFVNFCGATISCMNVNRSATSTPYPVLAGVNGPPDPNFSACNAAGLWRDTDGDSLSDAAESQGYIDINANGVDDPDVDIPLPGADPNTPDVYLHYDYTVASDHNHNPPPEAIQFVVDAFAAHGITLHIDAQHNAICENASDAGCITVGTGAKVVTLVANPNPSCAGPSAVSPHQLRAAIPYLNLIKPAYHYMVFGHWSSCDNALDCNQCEADQECGGGSPPSPGSYGSSEIFGDDSIVSFGTLVDADVQIPLEAWGGVTMHELGHNFGLFHGGGICDNYKPNYLSVMNYNFYLTGIPVGASPGDIAAKACTVDSDCPSGAHCSDTTSTCFRIDYSGQQLTDLNEQDLDETAGLSASPTSTDITFYAGPLNGQCCFPGATPAPTNGSPIDWNLDGNATEQHVQVDINGDGATTLLTGYNDWSNLNFAFQASLNFGD